MSSIITLTVSPCIDISTSVPVFAPDKKLHCGPVKKEPGGGGINVSRVLGRLGVENTAIYLAGGYTGAFFTTMLHKENVDTIVIDTENHTRENFVVGELSSNLQYRFNMPGPLIQEQEWKECLRVLGSLTGMKYIIASGSLTAGVPVDFFARVAAIAKQKNARLVLDTSGEALNAALEEGVFMIKPNFGELAFLSAIQKLDKETAILAANKIIATKQCEMVVVSMGAEGALVITDTISEHVIPPPSIQIKSTVGAGDSMVAGMVFGLSKGKTIKESLQYAVACGTAATMHEGTALCYLDDVERLAGLISEQNQQKEIFL